MRNACRIVLHHATCSRTSWLAGISFACSLNAATVSAQQLPPSESLEEIIVTARKTPENVQDVPMSVQVLSADFLDEVDLTRLIDLQFNIPGLVINTLGVNGNGFALRGVGDQGGSDQAVATYLNGVYLGISGTSIMRLFDMQRVEVLKGPQGTLYGRNATGGSINFITQLPEDEFSAEAEVAYGSFDTARVQGHVNLPFGNSALRLAAIGSEGDGYIRNSVDSRRFAEQDFWGLRASLLVNVTDRFHVTGTAQRIVDDGASNEVWGQRPDFLVDPNDIRLATVTLANPFFRSESDVVDVNAEYELGFATFRSISGYVATELNDLDDCAGTPFLLGCIRGDIPRRHHQWTQELQLVSAGDPAVDWLVGAYYFDDETDGNFFQYTPLLDPLPTTDRSTTSAHTAHAVFGQAIWPLADAWQLSAGLRLNDDQHRMSTIGTGTRDSPTLATAEHDRNNVSWRLDLQRAVSDEVLVYVGISTGFKSGGITILPDGSLDSFDPEKLTAYEAGVKSSLLDRRLTLNGAAFYYDFDDLQVGTQTLTASGIIFETDNAARAEIYGIDLDGVLGISDGLSVSAGVVWLPKREFVEYRDDQNGDVLSGNQLTRAPEWTVAAAISYEHPLQDAGTFTTRFEYNYRSSVFYTVENDPLYAQGGFGLVNLFVNFEAADGEWYVFASGRNLGDTDYFQQVFLQSSPGYPHTYELGFGYRF